MTSSADIICLSITASSAAEEDTGITATIVVKSITKTSADDINFLIFIIFSSSYYANLLNTSVTIAIRNVIIFITRLEKRIAMNIIIAIAAIEPTVAITFFPVV